MKTLYNFSKCNLLKVVIFVFLSILVLMPTTAQAQYIVTGGSSGSFSSLQAAVAACTGICTIIVTEDNTSVNVGASVPTIASGATVTLTSGSGGPFIISQTADYRHLLVMGALTVENVILEGIGKTSGATNGGIEVTPTGALNIKTGAEIRYCFSSDYGGGIHNQGKLNMTGGFISGNTASAYGGGIYNVGRPGTAPTAEISGGAISGNRAILGGGIHTQNCNMTIKGNAIIGGDTLLPNYTAKYGNYGNASAPTGNGGGVGILSTLTSSVTLTLAENAKIKNNRAGQMGGGGISIGANSILDMTGGTISGNIAATGSTNPNQGNGGGIYLNNTGLTSTISNGIIEGNYAYGNSLSLSGGATGGNGGGIYLFEGNLELNTGARIDSNEAFTNGGGVYILRDTFTMNEGIIQGNKALGTGNLDGGGGVFISSNSVFDMKGGVIDDNEAIDGGGGVRVNGVFNMSSPAAITNNRAIGITGTSGGGGVATTQSGAKFTMFGGTISHNRSATTGGGVRISSAANMKGGTIRDNYAPIGGGGVTITNADVAELIMEGGFIEHNTGGKGGGVRNFRSFVMEGGVIQFNKATADGGGLYNFCLGTPASTGKPFKFVMRGGEIKENEATGGGGGAYISRMPSEMYLNATIKENVAVTGNGGGVYVYNVLNNKYGYLLMEGNSQIINNEAPLGNGGGIFAIDFEYADPISNTTTAYWSIGGSAMNLTNVQGNVSKQIHTPPTNAPDFLSRPLRPFNGALLNNDQINFSNTHDPCDIPDWVRLQIAIDNIPSGDTIEIYTKSSGIVEMISGATTPYRLVLCEHEDFINSDNEPRSVAGKTVTIKSADIGEYPDPANYNIITLYTSAIDCDYGNSRHITVGSGGNLTIADLILDGMENAGGVNLITAGSILNINEGAVIQNCYYTGSGGGISSTGSIVNMTGGEIRYNTATTSGGGIYCDNSTINMSGNAEIHHNESRGTGTAGGGGIHTTNTNNTITMSGNASISYNMSVNRGGGVNLANASNKMTISGSATISHNSVTGGVGLGGGVYSVANQGNFIMNGGSINNNTAAVSGGGIYTTRAFTMNGGSITNNTAALTGGGIHSAATGSEQIIFNGGSITYNTASGADGSGGSGGGIYMTIPSNLTGTGGTFFGNTAPKAYWLDSLDNYLSTTGAYIINTHTVSNPWLKNPPATFSNPPAGNFPFEYAYNNYDVNWVGAVEENLACTVPVLTSTTNTVCSNEAPNHLLVATGSVNFEWKLQNLPTGLTLSSGSGEGSGSVITDIFTNSGTTPLIATYKVTLTDTTLPNCQNMETVEITVHPKTAPPVIKH